MYARALVNATINRSAASFCLLPARRYASLQPHCSYVSRATFRKRHAGLSATAGLTCIFYCRLVRCWAYLMFAVARDVHKAFLVETEVRLRPWSPRLRPRPHSWLLLLVCTVLVSQNYCWLVLMTVWNVCFAAAMKELLKQESHQRVYNGLQGY